LQNKEKRAQEQKEKRTEELKEQKVGKLALEPESQKQVRFPNVLKRFCFIIIT